MLLKLRTRRLRSAIRRFKCWNKLWIRECKRPLVSKSASHLHASNTLTSRQLSPLLLLKDGIADVTVSQTRSESPQFFIAPERDWSPALRQPRALFTRRRLFRRMTSSVSLSSVMCKRAAASLFCQEHVFLLSLSAPVSCHDVTDINQTREQSWCLHCWKPPQGATQRENLAT